MDLTALETRLHPRRIGRRLLYFPVLESTNTRAAEHAGDPTFDGLVVLADHQTAGRGRRGRRWLSPPGSALLCSVLLFPPPRVNRPAMLTTLAAVAVCEAIAQCTTLDPVIKWPNDVLVQDRKVCGILVEQMGAAVLGIGVNVNTPAEHFAARDLAHAASLAMLQGRLLHRETILASLLKRLDDGYDQLLAGQGAELEAQWRHYSRLAGRPVTVVQADSLHHGRLLDLGFAALVLEEPDGSVRRFEPETVEHVVAEEEFPPSC